MRKLGDIVLDQRPLTMGETATVKEASRQMRETGAGSVLVTKEDGRLAGIFTGRDAVCRVLAEGLEAATTPLRAVMTANPITMSPDRTAIGALRLMWEGSWASCRAATSRGSNMAATKKSAISGNTCADALAVRTQNSKSPGSAAFLVPQSYRHRHAHASVRPRFPALVPGS
jgi:CBS domain-containing protein